MHERRQVLIGGTLLAGSAAMAGTAAAKLTSATAAEQYAARYSAHDIDALAALFSDDYINHQLSAAAPPPAGLTPKAASIAFFKARMTGLPDLIVEIDVQVVEGDKVAANFIYQGTHNGPYLGFAPTGKRMRFTSCDIFRVRDGKIVEHWGMGDNAGVLAQLKAASAN